MSEKYRYRLKFKKENTAKYIGHLDLLKLFQRAMRRAGLPLKYTEGFNPHSILSFGQPLPVGMTSFSEYVEIELTKEKSNSEIISKLNEKLPDGIKILDSRLMSIGEKSAAALIRGAIYEISISSDNNEKLSENISSAIETILSSSEIIVEKTSKGNRNSKPQTENIRGKIFKLSHLESRTINAHLACGGQANLKPSVVAAEICRLCGVLFEPYKTQYTRKELIL